MVKNCNNQLTHSATSLPGAGKVPLGLIILVPLLLQILVTVGLTAKISLQNEEKALHKIAGQLQDEITDQIEKNVINYLEIPPVVNQINADSIQLGILNLENQPQVTQLLLKQMQQFPQLTEISLATQTPSSLTLKRIVHETNSLQLEILNPTNKSLKILKIDHQGNVIESLPDLNHARLENSSIFRQKTPIWTPITVLPGTSQLALSAQQPLFNSLGETIGTIQT